MYTPKKVFILVSGKYIEISYEEFCRSEKDGKNLYKDRFFLPLHGMLMEVTEKVYKHFYKDKRRQKYLYELSEKNNDISYDMITTVEFNGEDILIDNVDVCETVISSMMIEKLLRCISLLSNSEQELIKAIFFDGESERDFAKRKGVYHNAVHKRKMRILKKLRNLLEK